MNRQENWTMFLYLLMRDEVPLGTVARILQTMEAPRTGEINRYSNNGLHASAQDFMQRIDAL
jgi:hypothetical protein